MSLKSLPDDVIAQVLAYCQLDKISLFAQADRWAYSTTPALSFMPCATEPAFVAPLADPAPGGLGGTVSRKPLWLEGLLLKPEMQARKMCLRDQQISMTRETCRALRSSKLLTLCPAASCSRRPVTCCKSGSLAEPTVGTRVWVIFGLSDRERCGLATRAQGV